MAEFHRHPMCGQCARRDNKMMRLESRLAAADRLAEAVKYHSHEGYDGLSPCQVCEALADYEAKRKGEEGSRES